jgi:uncharacterized membrane protein
VRRERLHSVDLLRGAVMVLMALDHTRDYYSNAGVDATDLARSWPALFFTRFATHFCAPVFVLLAGAGAFLSRKPKRELQAFLLTRGLWLVALEVTVVTFAWTFNPHWRFVPLQVIWAIGWSMVALAALVELPAWAVGAVGAIVIAAHNLTDGVAGNWAWALLHQQRLFELDGHRVRVAYPLLPWIGVIAAGYGVGAILVRPDRRRWLAAIGAALVLAFVILRVLDGYGDPHPRAGQPWMGFLNCTKYPPSLDYLLMTLGPSLLVLAAIDKLRGGPIEVFGRVPLFFYVLHLYLIHFSRWLVSLFISTDGWSLPVVYAVWLAIVIALYWPCRLYANFKARHPDSKILSYL